MSRAWPLLLVLSSVVGCGPPRKPPQHVLISGSRALVPVLRSIGERFTAANPDVRIDFEPGSSNRGALDTRQGLADVGMMVRMPRVEETGLTAHPLARDAVAFLVHRDNPLGSLTPAQLVGLFSHSYMSWKELGGSDRPIILIGLSDGRSARAQFLDFLALEGSRAKPDVALPSSAQVVQAVAARPGAIGYASYAAGRDAMEGRPVRVIPLAGVLPDPDTISTSRYPFVRPAVLITRADTTECARRFVEFACSPDHHDLLRQHGFAPP